MINNLALICLLPLIAVGCAAPGVSPNPATFQSKAGHVADWQALADQATQRFSMKYPAKQAAMFVAPGPADMPFAEVYRNDLEMALIRNGYSVAQTAPGAVVLSFDVKTFVYGQEWPDPPIFANSLSKTRAEALITLTVSDDRQIIYSDSQPIYIRPADLIFYSSSFASSAPQKITASAPIPTVSLRIDSNR